MTKKKLNILNLLTKGLSIKQIAYELKKSEKTINNHIDLMFKISKSENSIQLVVWGIKNKYVEI